MTTLSTVHCSPSKAEQAHESTLPERTLRGAVSEIETIGIVSASNEAGRQLSEAENNQRDENLRGDLAGYCLRQSRGRFGDADKPLPGMVNPFTVVNIARETVVALGVKYHQFHVIFGVRDGGDEDLALRFELVEADWRARVLGERKFFVHANQQRQYLGAGSPDDRGRFFVIPGFDENATNPAFVTDPGA